MVYRRLLLCLAVMLVGDVLRAGVLDKRDFLISQDYSYSEQNNPAIASGLEGKFAVVWVDYRHGHGDIFCRLYDSGAVEIGDNFILNDDDAGAWQFEPDICSDWYGDYFVVWKDYRENVYPFDPDIYYQRLDSSGFVGGNHDVTTEPPDSSHQSPSIGAAGWGKTVISWADLRFNNWDVFARCYTVDGNPIGPGQRVNDDLSNTPQHEPDVAVSSSGWYVVVWYDGRSGNDDIFLQKYDSAGNAMGANVRINDDGAAARQKFPSVAIGGNDVVFIVWSDWRNGNYPDNPDIFGQRLDADLNRLGGNVLINLDGAQTAQRQPRVASDRMGNACVVWADSSAHNWDIKGQMFDQKGNRRDYNFPVNLDTDGKQLHPDVALDGHFLYLTWADDRNGNYDIYGRLLQYNDPSLTASPSRLDLSKDKFEPDPEAVTIILTNAGYGELEYRLETDQDWIFLSKSSGLTPDSFIVSTNAAGLDYGRHQGKIRLIDMKHNDSSAFIPVALTITGPLLCINPDSMNFKALLEIGAPAEQTMIISNTGSRELSFNLYTSDEWITLDKTTGSDDEIIQVGCDLSTILAGYHEGHVIAEDTGALNSPETLSVSLDLQTNLPYLAAMPDRIDKIINQGETVIDSVRIVNLGSSTIDWRAESLAPWLILQSNQGQDNEVISYSIETTSLYPGIYIDSITVEDSLAFNNPLTIPVEITIETGDTIVISSAQTQLGMPFQSPLYLYNHNPVQSGVLRFSYDTQMLRLDSLGPSLDGDAVSGRACIIDTVSGALTVILPGTYEKAVIDPGYYHLGDIYATANDTLTGTTTFQASGSIDSFYLKWENDAVTRPHLNCGELEISIPSDITEINIDALPQTYFLDQNSPNPFNGFTSISYGLKRSGLVRLEIFNILGQRIRLLTEEYRSAGQYTSSWNGRDEDGREMASGIYFYRLTVSEFSAVKKMVFLK